MVSGQAAGSRLNSIQADRTVLWPVWVGMISTQPAELFSPDTLNPNWFPDQCGQWFKPAVTGGGWLSLMVKNIFQIGFTRLGCERNAS